MAEAPDAEQAEKTRKMLEAVEAARVTQREALMNPNVRRASERLGWFIDGVTTDVREAGFAFESLRGDLVIENLSRASVSAKCVRCGDTVTSGERDITERLVDSFRYAVSVMAREFVSPFLTHQYEHDLHDQKLTHDGLVALVRRSLERTMGEGEADALMRRWEVMEKERRAEISKAADSSNFGSAVRRRLAEAETLLRTARYVLSVVRGSEAGRAAFQLRVPMPGSYHDMLPLATPHDAMMKIETETLETVLEAIDRFARDVRPLFPNRNGLTSGLALRELSEMDKTEHDPL